MAKVSQGVTITGVKANNPNAKYTLKYVLSKNIQIVNGKIVYKYSYQKLIVPASNKYSYN